ncbi:MAG: ATP-grasp domain-containing protein [Candidatus Nitronauta litoralis]|uniref:ATP-grasp domain-containing protein n=1 Tax=Candidatus Nitronauta litoralis TaxID=2705533 RepID=A0A7T0BXR0_9BACT|nr:MAG: ATP-grasp domain-containing protein [Candidatus Nitronauta litoralis]
MPARKKQHLLIIGGGVFQVPAIKTAQDMGLKVVVTDYNPDAEGMKLADFPIVVSTRNINLTVNAARQFHRSIPIDGAMTVGTDASLTVAAVANALNLPGIPTEVAERSTDKIKMRRCLKSAGVPVPGFTAVTTLDEARRIVDATTLPLVIKPCDNMGARGVKKINQPDDLPSAFQEAKESSISGNLILEEYMEGPEFSLDAIIYDGEITITGVADRHITREPWFVEEGHTMPSNAPRNILDEVEQTFLAAIRALGINHGAAKGDIKMTAEGAKIVEVASRLSGGWMSAHTYPLSSGVNLIRAGIEVALGQAPSDLKPKHEMVAVERSIIPPAGKILSIRGVDEAMKIRGVREIILMKEPGDSVGDLRSNMGKTGYVITTAKTREEAIRINELARQTLKVETGNEQTITWDIIRNNARRKFYVACKACVVCDGVECSGKVPGIGGIGTGGSFHENLKALARYKLNLRTIHNVRNPDISVELFGQKLASPVLAAPITGMETNLGGGMSEEEYAAAVLDGCLSCGTLGMVGDGASPTKYRIGLEAIKKRGGLGIPVFKPRASNLDILHRFHAATEAGAIAVGIDIDAASFKTMSLKGQSVGPKSIEDLQDLKKHLKVPFILKGIMNPESALAAMEAGADAIVVSNHGGRVMDYMPGTAEVLPEIAAAVNGRIKVLVDGGIRDGSDILKVLALGADAVLIGRPICIAAFGAGQEGVSFYLEEKENELKKAMILTGCPSVDRIDPSVIVRERKG